MNRSGAVLVAASCLVAGRAMPVAAAPGATLGALARKAQSRPGKEPWMPVATARNMSPGDVYAQLQKAGRLPELERSISEEKAFAWLLSQSTVVEATS